MHEFSTLFGRSPTVAADAPGRVNLMGEHTDYNDGFVLPTAIPQRSEVTLAPRTDRHVRMASGLRAVEGLREYVLGDERRVDDWIDYVQGCTVALRTSGHQIDGFDARIDSRVPIGAGVSSSAALEVSLLRALREAFGLVLDDVALARVAHRAEHFVGARVGMMDQMAASLADDRHALFLDTRTLEHERVPLPAGADLVVLGSGVAHHHATGGYNARRAECERACALLGVAMLRDLPADEASRLEALPSPLARRVRHVVTENARVLAAVAALRAGALGDLGHLFTASHASQRDDYAVSCPEIDTLIELVCADARVFGARLTGGGFGGAIVVLTRAGTGVAVATRAAAAYTTRTGLRAQIIVPDYR